VADDILSHYADAHPVAALRAMLQPDLDGVARVIGTASRYPDRIHYVEHAMALAADRAHPVPADAIDEVATEAEARDMRVVLAGARRLRGILQRNAGELAASLELFETMGARRYAARVRRELGRLLVDAELRRAGEQVLDELGELDALDRMQPG
jgi:hypothetical protein